MKHNVSDEAPERAPLARARNADDVLLASDRAGWAWEFLRRNRTYRAAAASAAKVRRRTLSNIAVIEAPDCAPEVRSFGLCFR